MNITRTHTLNSSQKTKIQCLLDACRKNDSLVFSFPFEDADLFLIGEAPDGILAIAAFLDLGSDTWECTAFTHPSCRKQGYFLALLEDGIAQLPPETDVLFYVNPRSRDAVGTMDALEAEVCSEEHMMEYAFPPDSVPLHDRDQELSITETMEGEVPLLSCRGVHGNVRITVWESHYYLYDFEIDPDYRGQGYGKKLLKLVMDGLYTRSPRPIRLQVSGDNLPALSLYKKTGFRITETLSCYLY